MNLYIKIALGIVILLFVLNFFMPLFGFGIDNPTEEIAPTTAAPTTTAPTTASPTTEDISVDKFAQNLANDDREYFMNDYELKFYSYFEDNDLLDEESEISLRSMGLNRSTIQRFNILIDENDASKGQEIFFSIYTQFRRSLVTAGLSGDLYNKKLKVLILLFIIISSEKHDSGKKGWEKWVYSDGSLHKESESNSCDTLIPYDGEYNNAYGSQTYNNIMTPCVTHDIHELLKYNDKYLMVDTDANVQFVDLERVDEQIIS